MAVYICHIYEHHIYEIYECVDQECPEKKPSSYTTKVTSIDQ